MLIDRALLDAILAEAAASPEVEVCGLLWGGAEAITRVEPVANVAADPARWFEIDPARLIAGLRASRTAAPGGERVVGHYHSHPSGRAEPSAHDLAAAEPGSLWLIVAGRTARLWRAGAGTFRETQLIVT